MAIISYRANLSSSIYPMTIAEGGRTVIMPGPDQNFDRRVDPTGAQKDAGIPQALYLENVIPTVSGYQSVGYFQRAVGSGISPVDSVGGIIELKALVATTNTVAVFPVVQLSSSFQVIGSGVGSVVVSGTAPDYLSGTYSQAVVRGVCYLLDSSLGYLYTCAYAAGVITLTNVTASVTPAATFFSTNSIRCIVGTNNYLLAVSSTKVFHSSTTTPTDFTASLVSGAGEISLSDIDGSALWALEAPNGFYLFGSRNNLYVQYTGNSRYPFKFTPVKNSSGIQNPVSTYKVKNQLFGEVDSVGHFVIEKDNQIKFIQGMEASAVAPEVTDFLSKGNVQELFNTSTNTFTPTSSYTYISQIYLYLNRYLLVSVQATGGTRGTGVSGVAPYDAAIIYDIVLQRYGKLKIVHTDIFTADVTGIGPDGIAKSALAFLNRSGNTVKYMSMDMYSVTNSLYTAEAHAGVLVLGKFQYVRSRMIQLYEIQVEGLQDSAITASPNFSCVLLPSLSGRTFDAAVTPYQVSNAGGLAVYNCHTTAQNHSVVFKGAFNLTTVQLRFSPRGDL